MFDQLWNTAMHATGISLVTHGGFGFHTTEIMQRFGPSTITFFFKVPTHLHLPLNTKLLLNAYLWET
jgi:hypothetical protein